VPKWFNILPLIVIISKLLQYAFEQCDAHRIIGRCDPENSASWKLLERLSMRREGHFLQPAFFNKSAEGKPNWHNAYEYAIIDKEWFAV
jgi:RimJ/RimL family protein N-acetyltransferase